MSARPSIPTAKPSDTAPQGTGRSRQIALVMVAVAASLAVASTLHLSGAVASGPKPYDATDAGIAEGIIGAALVAGAVALWRAPGRGRPFAIGATVLTIVGFLVGLNFTARPGHTPDLVYHLAVLPILVATLVVLVRSGRVTSDRGPRTSPEVLTDSPRIPR